MLDNRLFMQKSHDFGFKDPLNLPGKYIIQYRHPIPRMQSNFDHNVHVTGSDDSAARFWAFARHETDYFIRFWKKWMERSPANVFILSYEDMTETPHDSLLALLRFIQPDRAIDEEALSQALSLMKMPSGSSLQHSDFTLRKVESYCYYDVALYRNIEQQVFEACPGLTSQRLFPS
jgi:hypothetical protein